MPVPRRGCAAPLFVVSTMMLVLLLGASFAEEDCIVGPDGTQVCNETDNRNDDCVDQMGTTACIDLLYGSTTTDACIEQFPTLRQQCAIMCHLCHVLTTEQLTSSERYELSRLYSAEFPQIIEGQQAAETYRYLQDVDEYMYETVYQDEEFSKVRTACQNQHELCTFWAMLGECEKNPKYMEFQCSPACFSCDKLDFDKRCPHDPDEPTHFSHKGELNAMFENILTNPALGELEPKALMRPNPPEDSGVPEGPWIVVLENFLTEAECEDLIRLGAERGYERSMDVGEKKADGTYGAHESKDRTSSNAWCIEDCWEHETTRRVHDRLELLTGVDRQNYEYLQLLKYNEGEFYGSHHDYIWHHVDRAQGARTLTVFLYLNDVEAGGGTHFSKVNQTVQPKRGRAVIWPSVLDESPNEKDRRTDHEALPVEKGVKYGANAWIHQRDFKTPWQVGCH